jgi:hypothetical protein
MNDDKSITLKDGSKLQWLTKDYRHYLNLTTVIYGQTGSGKSIILDEIMYLLKPYIPVCFVVSQSNSSNNAYTNKVGKRFIKKTIESDWIDGLLQRQKNASSAYSKVNDMLELKHMFDRIINSTTKAVEKAIIDKAKDSITYVDNSDMLFFRKKAQKNQITEYKEKALKKLYKKTIRRYIVELENLNSLSKVERGTIEFLDFNPNLLFILDDCASNFKKWYKKTTAIKEIFYEGRHYNFSNLITSQDDKEIDSELRKNTRISIFTTAQSAISNFERKSNYYPKNIIDKARLCIDAVFKQKINEPTHYQKLVYIQGSSDPFRYTIADTYEDFTIGSSAVWEYNDRIKSKNSDSAVNNNPFFEKYS